MITYLIEVSICWLLFYSIYILLLSKETFFNINRWYLLSTLVLGLLIPLFTVEFSALFYQEPTNSVVYLAEGFSELEAVIETSVKEAKTVNFSWYTLLMLGYLIGVTITFIRFFYGFRQIYGLYKEGQLIKKGKYQLVLTKTPHLPFSFFNYLFWNEDLTLADKDSGKIITHELAHINQWHSLDVLFLEFLGIALWFSPPIYWYKKSLRTVHEYLADAYVLRNTKKKQYGHLLIRQVQSGMQVALANNFIHSQLKQRINMMTRNKSRRKALTRYLAALPLLLLMVLVFSNKNVQQNFNETTAKASLAFEELSPDKDTPPVFPGGEKEMLRFIYTNIKYPVEARSKSIYGNITAQFIVEKDGSISNLRVKNDLGGGLKEEVLRVLKLVQEMPAKWTPATQDGAVVRFTYELPFAYHLEGENEDGTPFSKKGPPSGIGAKIVVVGLIKTTKNNQLQKADAIYKEVDEMPSFPGCETNEGTKKALNECAQMEMLQFIYTNIKYPEAARKEGIEGTVVVKFVVDETGKITTREIVRSIGGGTDKEVLAVVDKMPTWVPGKKDGETVSVYYHLPVKFKLAEDAKPQSTEKPKIPSHTANGEQLYKVVDEMPLFPGCEEAGTYSEALRDCANKKMLEFIYTNVKYPKTAQEKGVEGVVVVRFIVEKDGIISDAEILRNPGAGTGAEALRVVNLMAEQGIKWIPGRQDGKAVNVNFNLPIKFKLADDAPKSDKKIIYHPSAPKIPIGYEGDATKLDLGDKTIIMNVFPNPVSEQMSVTLEGNAKDVLLTVFDLSGKEYFKEKIQSLGGILHKTIPLNNAPAGTLIVNVRHKGKDYQKKVIVQ